MDITVWEKKAIESAVQGAWQTAIDLNKKILKRSTKNIGALNRLARAFLQVGNLTATKKTYQRVLKIDQHNPIALKNLKRLTGKNNHVGLSKIKPVTKEAFLEEPRKTKVIQLVRLTSAQQLADVDNGDEVFLVPKKRFVGVVSQSKVHLGCLPEDISRRLLAFMNGGNQYAAFVKIVGRSSIEILVKETFRSKRFRNRPSF